jgi:hypothetical protein
MTRTAARHDSDLALAAVLRRAKNTGMLRRHQYVGIGENDATDRLVCDLLGVIDDPVHEDRPRQALRLFLMTVAPYHVSWGRLSVLPWQLSSQESTCAPKKPMIPHSKATRSTVIVHKIQLFQSIMTTAAPNLLLAAPPAADLLSKT